MTSDEDPASESSVSLLKGKSKSSPYAPDHFMAGWGYTRADHDHLYKGDLPSSTDGFSLTSLETRLETTKFNDRPGAYALNHISKRKETSAKRQQQKQTRKINFKSIYQKGNLTIRPEISKDIISWAQSNEDKV